MNKTLEPEPCAAEINDFGIVVAVQYDVLPG